MLQYRVGLEIPKIEVPYENLSVEGDVYVGSGALPTLRNVTLNIFEVLSTFLDIKQEYVSMILVKFKSINVVSNNYFCFICCA